MRRTSRGSVGWALAVVGGSLALSLLVTASSLGSWMTGDDLQDTARAVRPGPGSGPAHLRPLTLTMLRLNHALGGLGAGGYRVVTVVLHAVVIVLVGWTATVVAGRAGVVEEVRTRLGLVAGVVFGALATHAEAVSWIATRGEVVACGGVLVLVATALGGGPADPRRRTAVGLVGLSLALAAKEQAVVGPVLVLVTVAVIDRRSGRSGVVGAVRTATPAFALLLGYLLFRAARLGSPVGSYQDQEGFDLHPLRAPARLVVMTVRTVVPGAGPVGWGVVGAVVALLGVAAVAWRARARSALTDGRGEVLVVAAAATVVGVLPGVALGVSLIDGRGDRLLYTASAFAAVAVAVVVTVLWDAAPVGAARRVVGAGLVVVLVASAATAVDRDRRWAAAGDLSAATVRDDPVWDTPARLIVLDPVDTLRGAYVHRNALNSAATLVHDWPDETLVTEVVPVHVADADFTVHLDPIGDRRWRMRLGPGVGFAGAGDGGIAWDVPGVVVDSVDDRTATVTLGPDVDPETVVYVSGRRLHRLAEP